MKTLIFSLGVALIFFQSAFADNDKLPLSNLHTISWADVPVAAQRALRAQSGNASGVGVLQGIAGGEVIYVGRFQREGKFVEVPIRADGSMYTIQDSVAWNGVPTAVQDNFRAAQNLSGLQSISRQETGSRTIYIFSVLTNGRIVQVQYAGDGTFLGAIEQVPSPVSETPVAWNQLPEAVQKSATAQAGTAQISGASREILNGETVYEITTFEPGVQQKSQFRVAENGSVLGGTTITEAAGAERTSRGLTLDQLPARVQATMKTYTGAEEVKLIQPTFLNGRLCYEISFRRDGQPMSVCVAEDGGLIK